ncbi:MAG: twin-arginine translocation signal domain-containing protein [Alphaproteobacteria bacterium]|nr:twin-arginine translocation signal domain-containing protein [Alphaproteobacteria bacterium]MBL6954317.1 twin-arginine translocation signal domain-containing protein [Alphaproteobacteria bacterium]
MKEDKGHLVTQAVKRRDFLKQAGLVLGTAGAAGVMAKSKEAQAVEAENSGRGYRETEHVRTYYELAKF